jgi:hypothetical protein
MIFGKWTPLGALGGALLFGFADALQIKLQIAGVQMPYQFLSMTPYVVTMIVYPVFAVHFQDKDEETESRFVHLKRYTTVDRWGETEHEFEATIKALQFIEAVDPVTDLIETAADWGITINERELKINWT